MSITFSPSEVGTYYSARGPDVPQRGRVWRAPCPVHKGDGLNFTIDPETGLCCCLSQCGRGWDIIGLEMALSGISFKQACADIGQIIGRDLLSDKPIRPRFSDSQLCKAEMMKLGLLWRIDRALRAAKEELYGPKHEQAAEVTRKLTAYEARVKRWTAYDAAEAMAVLSRELVRDCIREAREAYDALAGGMLRLLERPA